jgi:hypothetical protein
MYVTERLRSLHLLAWAVLCALVGPAVAQGTLLQWAWVEGQRHTYTMTEELDQESSTEVSGESMAQSSKDRRIWTLEQSVVSVKEGGVATIRREYVGLEMTHESDGTTVKYDSERPDEAAANHPRIKPFASFVGRSIEFDVDREGRVLAVRGGADLMRGLVEGMSGAPIMGAGLGAGAQVAADEMFRHQIEQSLRIVPGRRVRVGESWDGSADQPVPILGSVGVQQTHTYKGTKRRKGRDCAEVTTVGRMSLPEGGLAGGLLTMKISESGINATTLLDVEQGTLVHSEARMLTEITGSSPLVEGMSFRQKIEQRAEIELISGG